MITSSRTHTINLERTVAADIDDVWRAITEPDDGRFFIDDYSVESSWMPGELVTWRDEDGAIAFHGVIVDVDAPHRLVHTFVIDEESSFVDGRCQDTQVTWSMEPGDDGTELVLQHAGFSERCPVFRAVEERWEHMLDALVDACDD